MCVNGVMTLTHVDPHSDKYIFSFLYRKCANYGAMQTR